MASRNFSLPKRRINRIISSRSLSKNLHELNSGSLTNNDLSTLTNRLCRTAAEVSAHSMLNFSSDNYSGVCPEIMQAINNANEEAKYVPSYGSPQDPITERARKAFEYHFGTGSKTFFMFTGTAANCLALTASSRGQFDSIVCSDVAHINNDECGAPERLTGLKLLAVDTINNQRQHGKLTVNDVRKAIEGRAGNVHTSQPRILSITQTTERGTIYSKQEIKSLCDFAHSNNMIVHMDGARLFNAAAALGCERLGEFTTDVGVDVVCVGGTKSGAMFGEAVVFAKPQIICENSSVSSTLQLDVNDCVKYMQKQMGQLPSKMRFLASQFEALLDVSNSKKNSGKMFGDSPPLWFKNTYNSNVMAQLLYSLIKDVKGVQVLHPVDANCLFVRLPSIQVVKRLQEQAYFYTWSESDCLVRWMTSFSTTEDEVRQFAKIIDRVLKE